LYLRRKLDGTSMFIIIRLLMCILLMFLVYNITLSCQVFLNLFS